MIGLQEIARRMAKEENKDKAKQVLQMLDDGYYDHQEFNMFGKGFIQREQRVKPVGAEDAKLIMESVRGMTLAELKAEEFLARSGSGGSGIASAGYLIPTKIYQVMYDSAVEADVVDAISITVIPADQIGGSTMNVDIAVDEQYKPHYYSSGGAMPTETMETTQATLDFTKPWGINFKIANDLIEDSQFDVIEMHIRNAGREMGEFASNEALTVLKTATDGDGTVNSGTSGDADETKFQGATADVVDAIKANLADGFVSDTIAVTHEAMLHSIMLTVGAQYNESEVWNEFAHNAWPQTIGGLNVVYSDTNIMTNDKAMTNCLTIVFDKDYALLSGRKRWLRIENYSDPIRDLTGATITARQDSVTIYDDSIYVITET